MKKGGSTEYARTRTRPTKSNVKTRPEQLDEWLNKLGLFSINDQRLTIKDLEPLCCEKLDDIWQILINRVIPQKDYEESIRLVQHNETTKYHCPPPVAAWKQRVDNQKRQKLDLMAKRDLLLGHISRTRKAIDVLKSECRADSDAIKNEAQSVSKLRENWVDKMIKIEFMEVNEQYEAQQSVLYEKYSRLLNDMKRVVDNQSDMNGTHVETIQLEMCKLENAISSSDHHGPSESLTSDLARGCHNPTQLLAAITSRVKHEKSTRAPRVSNEPCRKMDERLQEWKLIHDAAHHHVKVFHDTEFLKYQANECNTRYSDVVTCMESMMNGQSSDAEISKTISLVRAQVENDAATASYICLRKLEEGSTMLASRMKALKFQVKRLPEAARQLVLQRISENTDYASYVANLSATLTHLVDATTESSLVFYKRLVGFPSTRPFLSSSDNCGLMCLHLQQDGFRMEQIESAIEEVDKLQEREQHLEHILSRYVDPSALEWSNNIQDMSCKLSITETDTFLSSVNRHMNDVASSHAVACRTQQIPALQACLEETR
ncbi:hypothetical protein SeMB42_g07267, partial [Synchytrium endobioticum]